ncbi:DUF5689 domain-containing protein [Maribacter sp. CXY002]|uniref:DUF5689 domain-containing protein n=1 Tax=Maribacter luteocoastalis TaxID=3407671 RepID=UPI003B67DA68
MKSSNFDAPSLQCETDLKANTTFGAVKGLYVGETFQIQEDLVIEGYINSSDRFGNFFGTLHFQDAPNTPLEGFQIEMDLRDSHLFYSVGSKVLVKLKGLYLGKSKGLYKLGDVFNSFGNRTVGRLPSKTVNEHVLLTCSDNSEIIPTKTSIPNIDNNMVNTLIELDNVEFKFEELGKTFAEQEEETDRVLIDCDDNELVMINSGYSDFQETELPTARGKIRGLLTLVNSSYRIIIRGLDDISFNEQRCDDVITEFTSDNVFISELADPDNNSGARFVEIYNAGQEPLSLNGWKLLRYTNASLEISSQLDLSDYNIGAESTLVVSPNGPVFETIYGFQPDVITGTNSPADSNGDDTLLLVDPFGSVIDIFGRIGEDGSGTDHEFEDGRAVRKIEVIRGNPNYSFFEWIIFNDTGESGTTNSPKNAPNDFTPGER